MRLAVLDPLNRPGLETGPRSIAAVKVLRLSITDRCNFRCVYCMPADGMTWLAQDHILTYEEIRDVVRAAVELHGIRRFKLTGGEPTVRRGLVDLVGMLRNVRGVEDLSLTTNGQRLIDLAHPLRQAGLDRVTISVDSLDPEKFRRITRTGDLATVLRGIEACDDAGFTSTKINCVTMRGTNDDELTDFARLTIARDVTVRFIEYMPLGDAALMTPRATTANGEQHARNTGFQPVPDALVDRAELGPAAGCGAQERGADSLIPESEVRAIIEAQLGPLDPVDRNTEAGVGPANVYRLRHHSPRGRVGFISAMSQPFCDTCNRLRLTADGTLRSCLFEGGEVDVRSILRSTLNDPDRSSTLARAMTECVRLKPDVHSKYGNAPMSRIGG